MKNKNNQPLISVIMPVYNAGDFLVEAIESILKQTYKNFEFIIVNDASNDNSLRIIKYYKKLDKRIKIINLKKHVGVSQSVKLAIEKAKGKYLARMDADDISHPKRLETQLKYLLKNKDTVAVGCQCYLINEKNKIIGKKIFPIDFKNIYKFIYKFIPIQQPTLMINRNKLPKDFEFYYDYLNTAEEVELIFKLFNYGKVENINKFLFYYRIHKNNTSIKNLKKTFLLTFLARIKAIIKYNYKPDFISFLINLIQAFIIFLLPEKILFRIYFLLIIKQIQTNKIKLNLNNYKINFLNKINYSFRSIL